MAATSDSLALAGSTVSNRGAGHAIVPDELSAHATFPIRQRHLARIAMAIGVVAVMLAAMIAISVWGYRSNQAEAFDLASSVLRQLDRRVATQVQVFLEPAARLARLAHDSLRIEPSRRGALSALAAPVERFALSGLREYPQTASMFFADPAGNFVFYKRMPGGNIDTRIIERGDGTTADDQFSWIRRDPAGQMAGVESAPADSYDARTRDWYASALGRDTTSWSSVYVFFTDQSPGVTASLARSSGGPQDTIIVGLDIQVARLSALLADMDVPGGGTALIADEDGTLIAIPEPAEVLEMRDGKLAPRHLDALDNPVLARAWERSRVEGAGVRQLSVDGIRYVSSTHSLAATVGREWTVLTVAPEHALAGFTVRNIRGTLLLSAFVLALASLLGWQLVRQGRRADQAYVGLLQSEQALENRSRAFTAIAEQGALFEASSEDDLASLAELVCAASGTRRASIWRYDQTMKHLVCRACFDADHHGHTQGAVLERSHYSGLIAALNYSAELLVAGCAQDKRTSQLHNTYLEPVGCDTLVAIPARAGRRLLGALMLEHDDPAIVESESAIGIARMLARLLELRWARDVGEDGTGTHSQWSGTQDRAQASAARGDSPQRSSSSGISLTDERRIAMLGEQRIAALRSVLGGDSSGRAHSFENAAVITIRLANPLALLAHDSGANASADVPTAVDLLVQRIEALAERQGVEYLKLLGDEVVCACGLSMAPQQALAAAADLALAIRAQCAHIFTDVDRRLEFRIGLDLGPAVGCTVGREQRVFNLWGDSIRTACALAASGDAGGILTSGSVYAALSDDYLFAVRGRYFIPEVGEMRTYALTGRL